MVLMVRLLLWILTQNLRIKAFIGLRRKLFKDGLLFCAAFLRHPNTFQNWAQEYAWPLLWIFMSNPADKVQREEVGGIPEPPSPMSAVGREHTEQEKLVSVTDWLLFKYIPPRIGSFWCLSPEGLLKPFKNLPLFVDYTASQNNNSPNLLPAVKTVCCFDVSENDPLENEAVEGQIAGIWGQGHSHFLCLLSDFTDFSIVPPQPPVFSFVD